MRRSCLALLLGLGLLIEAPVAAMFASPPFAISVVQVAVARGDDPAVTFGSGWGVNNHIVVAAILSLKSNTLDLTGIVASETTLSGFPIDHTTDNPRGYMYCFPGTLEGGDTSFTASTSASAVAAVVAVEISGGSCTQSGSSSANDDNNSPYELTTDLSLSAGAFMLGLIRSTGGSNYTVTGSGTAIGAAGIGSNSDILNGDGAGDTLGQFQIVGGAGSYDTTYTSTNAETSLIMAAAVQAAASAVKPSGLLLLGVGGR